MASARCIQCILARNIFQHTVSFSRPLVATGQHDNVACLTTRTSYFCQVIVVCLANRAALCIMHGWDSSTPSVCLFLIRSSPERFSYGRRLSREVLIRCTLPVFLYPYQARWKGHTRGSNSSSQLLVPLFPRYFDDKLTMRNAVKVAICHAESG